MRPFFNIELKPEYARNLTRDKYKEQRHIARLMRRMIAANIDEDKMQKDWENLILYGTSEPQMMKGWNDAR